ncbi:MarR family winged helix-turn-helix transcriptional regulator [Kocuria sp. M1N1S27]|uniref:MarR family winged helix-turn-helix transcriptional regulator n=1 Tax=Kocuria kalidii TaxID=3376283 RepID=UPI003794E675
MNPYASVTASEPGLLADGDQPRVTYLVKRLESAVRRDMDAVLQEQGLTTPQYAALSILRRSPGLSSAQLARRAFVTAQSMQVMVAAFVRHGFVQRQSDADNQRILRNYLTETGEAVLARSQEAADQLEQRMVEGLSEEQVRCLRDAMDACVRNLSAGRPATVG